MNFYISDKGKKATDIYNPIQKRLFFNLIISFFVKTIKSSFADSNNTILINKIKKASVQIFKNTYELLNQ